MNYLNKLNTVKYFVLFLIFSLLSACGSGSGGVKTEFATSSVEQNTIATPLVILNAYSDTTSKIHKMTAGSSVMVAALLVDNKKNPIPNTLVNFKLSEEVGLVSMNPNSGKVVTDSSGIAKIMLTANPSSSGGTISVTASAIIDKTVITSDPWVIEIMPAQIILGTPSLSVGTPNPLPAKSIASIKVPISVLDPINGQKVPSKSLPSDLITATSICSLKEPALANLSVISITEGIATINYKNLGCDVSSDEILISLSNSIESATISIPVSLASLSELRYLSATPSNALVVKGTGGVNRQETGTVTFQLVNSVGNPVSDAVVTFEANTTAGGITVDPLVSKTDLQGKVRTTVKSGYLPTPVSILAKAVDPKTGDIFTSSSSLLSISAGPPEQKTLSLSTLAQNIRGDDIDGNTTDITIRLADNWGNAITDGTVVNMISEGGKIASDDGSGHCITVNSACTMTFTAQNFRPEDRKISITAFAKGIEGFKDANKNGIFDSGEECGHLGSPFVDSNENNQFDIGELLIPNLTPSGQAMNTVYDPPKLYQPCTVRNSTYVYDRTMIILSGPPIPIKTIGAVPTSFGGSCSAVTIRIMLADKNDNPIAAGSTITIQGANNIVPLAIVPATVPSSLIPTVHSITVAPSSEMCNPQKDEIPPSSGSFTIVATSKGLNNINDSVLLPITITR